MSSEIAGNIKEKLFAQGWHIKEEGLSRITQNNSIKDFKTILQNALDSDLKDIGAATLADVLSKKSVNNIVVQIQKVRNISAPKANEDSQAAPRMLKLIITDGHTHCQAIESESVQGLSLHKTAPGSKLHLKNAIITSGYIFLSGLTSTYLGGKVPSLYEKWEVNKNISNFKRGDMEGEGPPPWVNFGTKISGFETKEFKSLETPKKDDKPSDFEMQRKDAIAEAASGAIKKVFGGGTKTISSNESRVNNSRYNRTTEPRNMRKGKKEPREKIVDEKPQKPSENVSLFSFLEDKLPANQIENNEPIKLNQNNHNNKPNKGNQNYSKPQKFNDKPQYYNNKYNYNDKHSVSNNYIEKPQQNYSDKPQQQNQYNEKSRNERAPRFNNKPNNIDSLTNNVDRLNMNASFASKAFKQHLNLPNSNRKESNSFNQIENHKTESGWNWKIGDHCMAKYWEDNKYYNATITAFTNKTCVVQFTDYGNMEEVLRSDCLPVSSDDHQAAHLFNPKDKVKEFSGPADYRQGGNRNYFNKQYRKNYQDRRD